MRNQRAHRVKPQPLERTFREAQRQIRYIFHSAKAAGTSDRLLAVYMKSAKLECGRGKPTPRNPEDLEGIYQDPKPVINLRERYKRTKSKQWTTTKK